jgi:ribosome biogenesis protein SSF1/2
MRHYAIRNKPLGVSRSVRKVVSSGSSAIPNLRNVVDIAHYVTGESGAAANGGDASDSEGEDDLGNELPSELFDDTSSVGSRGGPRGKARSAVKLTEIGPRMSMRLIKVERGVCSGDVMFHAFEKRSATEALKQKRTHDDKVGVVKARRDEQRANVKRKRDGVVAKREAKAARREARAAEKAEAAEEEGGGAAAAAAPARDRAGPARNKGRDDEEEGDLVFDLKSIGRARI